MEKKTLKRFAWISSNYYLEEERIGFGEKLDTLPLDLYETHEEIIVEIDLPGIDPGFLDIKMANNQLIIEGKRGLKEEEGVTYLRMERSHEDFRRMIQLPRAVNSHKARACYERGVLILLFPKIKDRRREEIAINIE